MQFACARQACDFLCFYRSGDGEDSWLHEDVSFALAVVLAGVELINTGDLTALPPPHPPHG